MELYQEYRTLDPERNLDMNTKRRLEQMLELVEAYRSMDPDSLSGGRSTEDLLAEQAVAVERALAFNRALVKRLADENADGAAGPPGRGNGFVGPPPLPSLITNAAAGTNIRALHTDLNEPLLGATRQALGSARESGSQTFQGCVRKDGTQTNLPLVEDMQRNVGNYLEEPEYSVEDHYHETGTGQALAKSRTFQNLTLFVIGCNALFMRWDTDFDKEALLSDAGMPYQVGNQLFCIFFVFEIGVRFCAFRQKCDFFCNGLCVFDLVLVFQMIFQCWIQVGYCNLTGGCRSLSPDAVTLLRLSKVLRIGRVARILRMLRSIPQLMVLVRGMAAAMQSVGAVLILLIIVVYAFAIYFNQMLAEVDPPLKFGAIDNVYESVPTAMHFLFLQVVLGPDADFITDMLAAGGPSVFGVDFPIYWVLYLIFLLIGFMTVMNMLIGILCDVVTTVSDADAEERFMEGVNRQVNDMITVLDKDGSMTVSEVEFKGMIDDPHMMSDLKDIGVDVLELVEYSHFLFENRCDEMSLQEFRDLVLQFRGGKQSTVKDILDVRRYMTAQVNDLQQRLVDMLGMAQNGGAGAALPQMPQMSARSTARRQQVVADAAEAATQDEFHFPSVEEMKNNVTRTTTPYVYDVEDRYKETGACQAVARSSEFKNFTLVIILCNVIWIGVDADLNNAAVLSEARPVFQIVNNLFCVFFTLEILIRFRAFRATADAFADKMFIFDLTLTLQMAAETWIQVAVYSLSNGSIGGGGQSSGILRLMRVLRLARIVRIARLVRSMPAIMLLIKGMAQAVTSVSAVIGLLALTVYVFAIVFVTVLAGTSGFEEQFTDVPQAMDYLMRMVIAGSDGDFVVQLLQTGIGYWLAYMVFLCIGTMMLLNMLIGVLCEVISGVSESETEEAFRRDVERKVTEIVTFLDSDGSMTVSEVEFRAMAEDNERMKDLKSFDIDVVALVGYIHAILMDPDQPNEIALQEFIEMVIQFRGSNSSTVKDLVDMRRFVTLELDGLEEQVFKIAAPPDVLASKRFISQGPKLQKNRSASMDLAPAPQCEATSEQYLPPASSTAAPAVVFPEPKRASSAAPPASRRR